MKNFFKDAFESYLKKVLPIFALFGVLVAMGGVVHIYRLITGNTGEETLEEILNKQGKTSDSSRLNTTSRITSSERLSKGAPKHVAFEVEIVPNESATTAVKTSAKGVLNNSLEVVTSKIGDSCFYNITLSTNKVNPVSNNEDVKLVVSAFMKGQVKITSIKADGTKETALIEPNQFNKSAFEGLQQVVTGYAPNITESIYKGYNTKKQNYETRTKTIHKALEMDRCPS